ncbi:MAG: ribonuclease H-like domain-containing protein, partial [Promethearchaeota archaeon]
QSSASHILRLIKTRDYKTLKKNRYIDDLDLSFCFKIDDFLFLDIETLGLYDSPMIIVGLGYYSHNKFEIHIFFARDLEEEIAICEHLKNEILPNFKCFVTYNGKTFDIPYIANRFLYYFDENPMISNEDEPYETNNTKFHHIDLYHNCRRRLKGKFNNYTLTNMEKKLLNWERKNELPSSLVGICYKKYQKNPNRYLSLIKEIIEHNYYDVYSMPLILKELLCKE